MRSSRGFTLLEAIVALAVLAAAGLALFAAMAQAMQMLQRAEHARAVDAAMRDAIALSERIDPLDRKGGELALDPYVVRWAARPVEPVRDNVTGFLQPGLYQVGLFDVRLDLWRDGRIERSIDVRRAAWKQVRQPITP
jgi:general secretion pathway protein I